MDMMVVLAVRIMVVAVGLLQVQHLQEIRLPPGTVNLLEALPYLAVVKVEMVQLQRITTGRTEVFPGERVVERTELVIEITVGVLVLVDR